jgi:hypothetical protein
MSAYERQDLLFRWFGTRSGRRLVSCATQQTGSLGVTVAADEADLTLVVQESTASYRTRRHPQRLLLILRQ